jgi:hypothetical protein
VITETLIAAFRDLVIFIGGLLPTGTVPAWFGAFVVDLGTWLEQAETVSAWLPLSLMLTVMGALLVCIVAGFTIKLIRVVASFATLGGGSAG